MIIVCHLFPFGCATKLIGLKILFVRDCGLTTQRHAGCDFGHQSKRLENTGLEQ